MVRMCYKIDSAGGNQRTPVRACFSAAAATTTGAVWASSANRGFQRLSVLRPPPRRIRRETRPWAWRDEIPCAPARPILAVRNRQWPPQASSSWMHSCVTAGSALTMKIASNPIHSFFPPPRHGLRPLLPPPTASSSVGSAARAWHTASFNSSNQERLRQVRHAARIQKLKERGLMVSRLQTGACAGKGFLVLPAHDKAPARPSAAFSNRK